MIVHNREKCPRRELSGLVSRILLQQGDLPGLGLTTWVDVAPGAFRQHLHNHPSERVYMTIAGRGTIAVGDERREVAVGGLVYMPPNVIHGIENFSKEVLTYVSAASPAIDPAEAAYDT